MEETPLEEQADVLLTQYARRNHKSLRKIGILDRRTQLKIARREIPMSSVNKKREQED